MKRIAIIGGGLAGCAAAYVLKAAGHSCVIYEASDGLNAAASGNPTGLYNPRFGAEWAPQSQYFSAAFHRALAVFPSLGNIEFDPAGCLHLINDEKKQVRYSKMFASWGWNDDEMRIISAGEASEIAGIDIPHDALYLPESGTVSPPKLCKAYADGIEVKFNSKLTSSLYGLSVQSSGGEMDHTDKPCDDVLEKYDAVILCAGPALRNFDVTQNLDLRAVRGQVTMIKANDASADMACNICYSGYITKAHGGQHMVGSTFQRWLDHSDILDEDDADNLGKLGNNLPFFLQHFDITGRRASVRTTSKDHFPVVGQVDENVYVSTAHGSHGILSSLMAAEILGAIIDGRDAPVSDDVISALSPQRFVA